MCRHPNETKGPDNDNWGSEDAANAKVQKENGAHGHTLTARAVPVFEAHFRVQTGKIESERD